MLTEVTLGRSAFCGIAVTVCYILIETGALKNVAIQMPQLTTPTKAENYVRRIMAFSNTTLSSNGIDKVLIILPRRRRPMY